MRRRHEPRGWHARRTPGRGTFRSQRFIQTSSPEIWCEVFLVLREVAGPEMGGLFWATSLEKIIGGVTAIVSYAQVDRCSSLLRSEACYPPSRKHGRHRAVKRREFITLLGGAATDGMLKYRMGCKNTACVSPMASACKIQIKKWRREAWT